MLWGVSVLLALVGVFSLIVLSSVGYGKHDIFSPSRVVCYFFLLELPYYLLVAANTSLVRPIVQNSLWVDNIDLVIAQVGLLSVGSYLFMLAGVNTSIPRKTVSRKINIENGLTHNRKLITRAIVLFIIAVLVYWAFVLRIGGLSNLWQNLYLRTQMTSGLGYISYLYRGLLKASIILVLYAYFRRGAKIRALVFFLVLIGAFILASLGGRADTIFLVWIVLLSYNYWVRKVRVKVNAKSVSIAAVIILFFLTIPLFRSASAIQRYSDQPLLLFHDAFDQVGTRLFGRLSSLDRQAIMVGYFDSSRLWLGRSYVDLLMAPLPRGVVSNKPPVDDGMYIYAIALGRDVGPSRPANELEVTSWPPGIWIGYANFGIVGLLLYSYASGLILKLAYEFAHQKKWSPSSFFTYALIAWGGGMAFSNYGIVTFVMNMVVTGGGLILGTGVIRLNKPVRESSLTL